MYPQFTACIHTGMRKLYLCARVMKGKRTFSKSCNELKDVLNNTMNSLYGESSLKSHIISLADLPYTRPAALLIRPTTQAMHSRTQQLSQVTNSALTDCSSINLYFHTFTMPSLEAVTIKPCVV